VNVPRTPGRVRAATASPVGLPGAGIAGTFPKTARILGGAENMDIRQPSYPKCFSPFSVIPSNGI